MTTATHHEQTRLRLTDALYATDPTFRCISVDMFCFFGATRLQLLDELQTGGDAMAAELQAKLLNPVYADFPLKHGELLMPAAVADSASHSIARLVCCKTPDLQKWLVEGEAALFEQRMLSLSLTRSSERQEAAAHFMACTVRFSVTMQYHYVAS